MNSIIYQVGEALAPITYDDLIITDRLLGATPRAPRSEEETVTAIRTMALLLGADGCQRLAEAVPCYLSDNDPLRPPMEQWLHGAARRSMPDASPEVARALLDMMRSILSLYRQDVIEAAKLLERALRRWVQGALATSQSLDATIRAHGRANDA